MGPIGPVRSLLPTAVGAPQSCARTLLSEAVPTEKPLATALPVSAGSPQSIAQPTQRSSHLSMPVQTQLPDTVAVRPAVAPDRPPGLGALASTAGTTVKASRVAARRAVARRTTMDLISRRHLCGRLRGWPPRIGSGATLRKP